MREGGVSGFISCLMHTLIVSISLLTTTISAGGAFGGSGEGALSGFLIITDVFVFRYNLLKNFCACDLVCALVRVPINLCTLFQLFPKRLRASMKRWCSASVHRPVLN